MIILMLTSSNDRFLEDKQKQDTYFGILAPASLTRQLIAVGLMDVVWVDSWKSF